ncbi:MAG: phosphoribosylformylglycinamidine cyclo-ligase [Elusimicrobia bacterium RIFCSPLOWO2_01_FULL_59_12]|nr:MAG: phosphoribosylformylglycinamidine cyclo-ligase [Elusimicrobia bacterium RIFCSPLOWO2_01_FULL_59_12]
MITYKKAGVDIDAGDALVDRIKKMSPLIGGFAGMMPLGGGYKEPMLVGCTDGVGTKLKIAFLADKHDTVGIDLVAMNVNDLLCGGAKPLFFLDYFACGRLDVGVAEQVIKGIVEGCRQSDCVLLGGETAEMPGFYKPGEYDLAGFAVGAVDRKDVIDGRWIREGDVVLGLPSSGIHSNGYSLVRKLFKEKELARRWKEFLAPTRIYVKAVRPLIKMSPTPIKGLAHITGGGFLENIPRVVPKGLQVKIARGSWPVLDLFDEMQQRAGLNETEMFRTFNMGIGLVMVVSPKDVEVVQKNVKPVYRIGTIERGSRGVRFA